MVKSLLIIFAGIVLGTATGFLVIFYTPIFSSEQKSSFALPDALNFTGNKVIGFLPYWLLSKAQNDYSSYINTLTYFGLTIDTDGTILRKQNPQELEPGWNALNSGIADPFLTTARNKGQSLSLLMFDGNHDSINTLISDPATNAQNLITDVQPIMKKYQFKDLNLDIEDVNIATDGARQNFTQFVKEVKKGLDQNHLGTLTIEISPDAIIKNYLINLEDMADIADHVVVMAYDFHYAGSMVTGPVGPLSGGGTISEFDTEQAVQKALEVVPPQKIILGIPLYGYGWETINESTRSATIPSSGFTASSKYLQNFVSGCATCSAKTDQDAQEQYVVYKDEETGTYHQIFYPDALSTQAKINYVKDQKLGGLALWALGYEDSTILDPLKNYKALFSFN